MDAPMKKFRVLVCGGRDYKDIQGGDIRVREALATCLLDPPEKEDVVLITGCAKGADQIPIHMYKDEEDEWGGLLRFPADWDKHGKAAGPIRNQQMLDCGQPDLVIAFPGGKGTAHMCRIAKAAGVNVIQIE